MQPQHLRRLAIAALIFLFASLAFISCAPPSYDNVLYTTAVSRFTFLENFDSWIEDGYRQYGELWLNKSLTAEIVVGKGERFEGIQEVLYVYAKNIAQLKLANCLLSSKNMWSLIRAQLTIYNGYNIVVPTQKLISIGNTYNWHGIDKTNVTTYLIFDRDNAIIEQNNETP